MYNSYIIITPCKNEEKNLPHLIESITSQTVRPILWVIVDDRSTDNTSEIIKNAQKKCHWIQTIQTNGIKRDLGLHLAEVIKTGFDYATSYCEKMKLMYNYIGNVDADLTLDSTFYENLIEEFNKNPKLGIASGGTKHIIGNKIKHAKVSVNEPSGGHMLIRKDCYLSCGGITVSYAVDAVLKAKARLKDWETKRFEDNIATEIRDASSVDGYWKGYLEAGRAAYFINIHPIHAFYRSLEILCKINNISAIAYQIGYFGDTIKRKEQLKDNEIKNYFWNKWRKIYSRTL